MRTLTTHRRHPAALLLVLLFGLLATGGTFALANSMTQAQSATADGGALLRGKQLYLEGCATCHGTGAEGTTNGPSLIGVGAASVDFQVRTGRMPLANPSQQAPAKPRQYSDEEIADLAAFIASLAPGPAIPSDADVDTTGANVAQGGELFRVNCSQCHQAAGRGGALSDGKYAPNLMNATPTEIYEAMITGPQNMPVFGDSTLPTKDKQAIIAYIDMLRADEDPGGWALGRFGPVTEGLFMWIGGLLLAIAVAIWIGAKVR